MPAPARRKSPSPTPPPQAGEGAGRLRRTRSTINTAPPCVESGGVEASPCAYMRAPGIRPITPPRMSVITDPLFYLLAIPAITILGHRQGRVFRHRHDRDADDRAGDPAAAGGGDRAADPGRAGRDLGLRLSPPFRHLESEGADRRRRDRRRPGVARRRASSAMPRCGSWSASIGVAFVLYTWLGRVPAEPKKPRRRGRRILGRADGHHVDAGAGRRAALPDLHAAAEARQADAGRHHADLLRGAQLDEARTLFRARPVHRAERWRPRRCCCRSRSRRISSASGWCDACRTKRSTRSPMR